MSSMPGYRTRTQGGFFPGVDNISYWWDSTQSPKPAKPAPFQVGGVRGTVKVMTDYVTPGFKQKSARGEIINTAMSKETETRRSDGGRGPYFQRVIPVGGGASTYVGDLTVGDCWVNGPLTVPFSSASFVPRDASSFYAIARTRCYANIDKSDFSGLVSLGELRETLGFLRNPFKSGFALKDNLYGKLRAAGIFSKTTPKNSKNFRNELASAFLAFQYGLKPLVKEIAGICENLLDDGLSKPLRRTARAKETYTDTDVFSREEYFSGIRYTANYVYKRTVTIRCGILYDTKFEAIDKEKWGLRPKDIPLAVWQVTSLSFVADWFGNVGDFISAITPSAGTRTLAMWTTTIIEETLDRKTSDYKMPDMYPPFATLSDGSIADHVKRVTVVRDPSTFAPSLAFRDLTDLKNDVSRLTSLAALFSTRLGDLTPYEPKTAFRRVNTRK